MRTNMADDLGDDLWIAGDEPVAESRSKRKSSHEHEQNDNEHTLSLQPQKKLKKSKQDSVSGDALDDFDGSAISSDVAKQEKKKARRKAQKAHRRTPDVSTVLTSTNETQAEYLRYWYKETAKTWRTELELEDRKLDADHVFDTTAFSEEHTDEHFAAFIKLVLPDWKTQLKELPSKKKKNKQQFGTPTLVVVTSAGLRAAEIIRHLSEFHELCRIPKLFAKHLKIDDQIEYLNKHVVRIAVGTPNRLDKLVESGALKLDQVTHMVIDCQKDVKQRSAFDIPEIRTDLFHFIEDRCWALIRAGQLKLALF